MVEAILTSTEKQLAMLVRIEEHFIVAKLSNQTQLPPELWLVQNGTSKAPVVRCVPTATICWQPDVDTGRRSVARFFPAGSPHGMVTLDR